MAILTDLFNMYQGYQDLQQRQKTSQLNNLAKQLEINQSVNPTGGITSQPQLKALHDVAGVDVPLAEGQAPQQPQQGGLAGLISKITGGGQQQPQYAPIKPAMTPVYSQGLEGIKKEGEVPPGAKLFEKNPAELSQMKMQIESAKMQLMQEKINISQQLADAKTETDRAKLEAAAQVNEAKIKQLETQAKLNESKMTGAGTVANPNPNLTGEAALQNYTPEIQKLAKKLVNADIPYPSSFALRDPQWKAAVSAATDLDPTWNASQHKIREATRKSFTSGPDAKNITSINTLVGHLNSLNESSEALNNRGWQPWNTVANWTATKTGDPKVTKFNMDLGAVESELAAVFKQTGATDQEIKAWRERIDASQSPAQLQTNIHEAVELMGSRLSALKNKYEAGMGSFGQLQILSPKSRQTLEKLVGKDAVDALEPKKEVQSEGVSKPQGGSQHSDSDLQSELQKRGLM